MRILVGGATGYLGRHLVEALDREGHEVVALVRDPERLGPALKHAAEIRVAQATDPASLIGVASGCDAVYSAVGVRSASRKADVWAVDRDANLNVFREAHRAGVQRAIFVSVLRADVLRGRGVAIAEAREQVADEVQALFQRWTLFRPTSYFNDMEALFHGIRRFGVTAVPDGGALRLNPIHGADLAAEIARALEDPDDFGRAIPVGGPEILTVRQIVDMAFEVLGKRPRVLSLPSALLTPAQRLAKPFNPTLATFLHALREFMTLPDMVAPPVGTRRLRPYLASLAAEAPAWDR